MLKHYGILNTFNFLDDNRIGLISYKQKCFFFYKCTRTWLPPMVYQTSPLLGVFTGQKLENKKKNCSHSTFIPQLLIHSLVLQERCDQI